MNLKLKKIIQLFILLLCLSLFIPTSIYAATTTSLAPSSGTYSADFTINLNVDTTDPISGGIDVNINFSGPIDYLSANEVGDECFSFSANEVDSSTVRIICMASEITGNTDIASITFRPTGEGTAIVNVEHNSGSGAYGTSTGGGTYNITSGSSSSNTNNDDTNNNSTTSNTSNSYLPQTSTQKYRLIIIGIISIIIAVFISIIYLIKNMKKKKNPEKYKTLDQLDS